jgi:class 3 adenylate cyclase
VSERETLLPFVSQRLAARLAEHLKSRTGEGERLAPERLATTLVLVDVVGFTQLAGTLAQGGPEGEEELSTLLANYYDASASLVHRYGGDIIAIAGDGIIASFEHSQGAGDRAMRMGIQCGGELLAFRLGTPVSGPLERRVAVASGEVLLQQVGDEVREHHLVSGSVLLSLGALASAAEPGAMVVDETTREGIRGFCAGEQTRSVGFRIAKILQAMEPACVNPVATSLELEHELRRHVSRTVLELNRQDGAERLAGFRRVPVVFVNLSQVQQDDREGLHLAVKVMQRALDDLEGTLHQFLMDEKGISAVVAFGLPPLAHDDDARRALIFAERIQSALDDALGPRIGIAFGRLYCGLCGQVRRSYAMVGPAINLAARLMQAAKPGQILADQEIAGLVGHQISMTKVGSIQPKGHNRPIKVFSPGKSPSGGTYGGRNVVAREDQLSLIDGKLGLLSSEGRGSVLVVRGEAGVGKSHLFAEVARAARLRDVEVFTASATLIERSTPYHVWRPILASLLDALDGGTKCALELPEVASEAIDSRADKLMAALDDEPRLLEWAPLLQEVLPLGLRDSVTTSQMSGPVRADGVLALVAHLMKREMRRGPLLLMLDDAHWFDSRTLALTVGLARLLSGIMIVVGTRPEGEAGALDLEELLLVPRAEVTSLSRLPRSALGALVSGALGVESTDESALELIWERTGGHPLHGIQLARMLLDSGVITRRDGRLVLLVTPSELSSFPIPVGLEATIAQRVDRLSHRTQLVLRTASVVGRTFLQSIVRELLPVLEGESDALRGIFEELEEKGLFSRGEDGWAFEHAITREVIYESLAFSQRRALHRGTARLLEADSEGRGAELAPVLGHHWALTDEPERAIPYLETAAERAVRSFSNDEAVRFVTLIGELAKGASSLVIAKERQAGWESLLGEASLKLGRVEAAKRHFLSSLALRGVAIPRSVIALGTKFVFEVIRQMAIRFLPGVMRVHRKSAIELCRVEAAICERVAEVAFFKGDLLLLAFASSRSLNSAEVSDSVPGMLTGYGAMAISVGSSGLHGLARSYRNKAVGLARIQKQEHLGEAGLAFFLAALYSMSTAEWSTVDEHLAEALDSLTRVGDRFRIETCRSVAAFRQYVVGNFDQAIEEFQAARDSAPPLGAVQIHVWCLAGQIVAQLPKETKGGRFPYARELAGYLEGPEVIVLSDRLLAHGQLALARMREGDEKVALVHADEALGLMTTHPQVTYFLIWPITGVAEVYLELWSRCDKADEKSQKVLEKKIRKVLRVLTAFAFVIPLARSRTDWIRGRFAATQGKSRKARTFYRRALSAAEAASMPLECGLACAGLASIEPQGSAEAERFTARASAYLHSINASYELKRLSTISDHS